MIKIPMTKRCSKCGRDLPFSDFYFNVRTCKYLAYCHECRRKIDRERRKRYRAGAAPGVNRYTSEEVKYITDNYMTVPYADIAEKLGRSYASVALKINKLGLIKRK